MFVEGFGHFLRTAAALQWDAAVVDLSGDARAWPALDARVRDQVELLVAGFCVAEAAVAAELEPFALAAADADVVACFEAQALDEARHARFFDRVAREVMAIPGGSAEERRAAMRGRVSAELLWLFEERLPAFAAGLARPSGAGAGEDEAGLASAVGLYHLLLEGVVFSAGQAQLLELLDREPRLAGMREGVDRVTADERWHIGFGVRLLDELGVALGAAPQLLAQGREALRAWGDVVAPAVAERVARLHERRLRAAGLLAAPARV